MHAHTCWAGDSKRLKEVQRAGSWIRSACSSESLLPGAADDSDVPAEPCAPGPRPPEAPAPSLATSVPVRAGPGLQPARSGSAAVRAVAEAAVAEAAAGESPQSDPALSSGKA